MNRTGIFALLLSIVSIGEAQETGTVTGHVREKSTRSPVPFANVVVAGTRLGGSTRIDGTFTIRRIPAGRIRLVASIPGYAAAEVETTLTAGSILDLEIGMEERPSATDEVVVTAQAPMTAASSMNIQAIDFELRPKMSTQDLLRLVPGLFIAQHAGGGRAEQIFLRGFDADHGTDVNVSVDGVPVNMVSHGHGQGYADLHFVLPEVLRGMDVFKGPYFARYGDFGTAGTVTFITLDEAPEDHLSLEAGSFGMVRGAALLVVPLGTEATSAYVAGEILRTDSYFEHPQDFVRFNLFGKMKVRFDGDRSLSIWASGFRSDWDASGQVPGRAVESGAITRFGSIDPTEGGNTGRYNVNAVWSSEGRSSGVLAQAYFSKYDFRLWSNFTFFKEDTLEGDEIEQVDDRWLAGGRIEFGAPETFGNPSFSTLAGASVRHDDIGNELWGAVARERRRPKALNDIRQTNAALYLQEDVRVSRAITLQVGVRADFFSFSVADRLRAGAAGDISGTVGQSIVSPKVNLTFAPSPGFEFFLNAGTGFHSNDARGILSERAASTLPRAAGAEFGLRAAAAGFTAALAFWGLDLDHELVYVGDEGTTEESGATRRTGIDATLRARIADWLWADIDLGLSRGRFRDLPDGADFIPLAPWLTSSGGLTARPPSGIEGTLRYRLVGPRPANEGNTVEALGSVVVDVGVGYRFGRLKFSVFAQNLLGAEWNEAQFDTESRLPNEAAPVSELHFTPGTPFSAQVKMEYAVSLSPGGGSPP
jgi:hypothetical protein